MYTITFPIHVFRVNSAEFIMPAGLARDILAQLRSGEKVNIIVPHACSEEQISSPFRINTDDHPGLQIDTLPYTGRRSFYANIVEVIKILSSTAKRSTVWHTGCSTSLFDLTSLSFLVGRYFAPKIRILCLDSDPASMLENSGIFGRLKARVVRARYRRWAGQVDAVIFVGAGVEGNYSRYSRRFVTTAAVWLNDGDLASESETIGKFQRQMNEIRFCLPSRLTKWKGVDDTIIAIRIAKAQLPNWKLEIIGDGPEFENLRSLANDESNISFRAPLDYGEEFFKALRSYDIIIVPTRGLEEARIAYDAAASGCVIVCSNTPTLQNALSDVKLKWEFEPGNPESLASALVSACESRENWVDAALAGIAAMKGRTIQEMHQRRSEFIRTLKLCGVNTFSTSDEQLKRR
jgi:glycosyltransferase involved in cell wall biosynthesis